MLYYQEASLQGNKEATNSLKKLFEQRCKQHEDKINDTNKKIKGNTLAKQCEEYIKAKKTIGRRLALWKFIGSQSRSDLLKMLVDMSVANGIDHNVLEALRMHPDPSVSQKVDTPSVIKAVDKKTGKFEEIEPCFPERYGLFPSNIPIILKEAYKVPGNLRKDFFNAGQFLPQLGGGILPPNVQCELLSYFPTAGLPVRGDIEIGTNNEEKKTETRSIEQTVLSKHKAFHRELNKQSGEIGDLKAFGEESYKKEDPEIKPVVLEMIEIANTKKEKRLEVVGKIVEGHKTFLEKRGNAKESWVKKIQEEQQKQEVQVELYLN